MESDKLNNILDEFRHAQLYRENAFNYFGLSSEARNRDFTRQVKIITQEKKENNCPENEIEEIKEKQASIEDPMKFQIQRFFWVWDNKPFQFKAGTDKSHLFREIETWKKNYNESQNHSSIHNITILIHILVLEKELDLLNKINSDHEDIENLWEECYSNWNLLIENDLFWGKYSEYIEALGDKQLKRFVDEVRDELRKLLYSIHADLVIRYVESNRESDARRQKNCLRYLHIYDDEREKALYSLYNKYNQRIKTQYDEINKEIQKNIEKADILITELLQNTYKILLVLNILLPKSSTKLDNIHEIIIRFLEENIEKFSNFSGKPDFICRVLDILPRINALVISNEQKEQVGKLENQILDRIIWFPWYTPNYYKQPYEIRTILKLAKHQCDNDEIDKAIHTLNDWINRRTYLAEDSKKCLLTALSYCYTRRGFYYENEFKKIATEISPTEFSIINLLPSEVQFRRTSDRCSSCGQHILTMGKFYLVIEDIKYLVCSNCSNQANAFYEEKKKRIIRTLSEARNAFHTARLLNPENNIAIEKEKAANELAKKFGIELDVYQCLYDFPNFQTSSPVEKRDDSSKSHQQLILEIREFSNRIYHLFQTLNYYVDLRAIGIGIIVLVSFVILFYYSISVRMHSDYYSNTPIITETLWIKPALSSNTATQTLDNTNAPPSSTPTDTPEQSTITLTTPTEFSVINIARKGNYIFVADGWNGLRIFLRDSNSNYQEIANVPIPGFLNSISIFGDYAYITAMESGLHIINISNPGSPFEAGGFNLAKTARSITIVDNIAYLSDGMDGVHILDINTPATSQRIAYIDTPGEVFETAFQNGLLYVSDGWAGLKIFDVSEVTEPVEIGSHYSHDITRGITLVGQKAYLAESAAGLAIIDIANPALPNLVQIIPSESFVPSISGGVVDVINIQNYLVVVTDQYEFAGLEISDPNHPSIETIKHLMLDFRPALNYYVNDMYTPVSSTPMSVVTPISLSPDIIGCTNIFLNLRKGPAPSFMVIDVIPPNSCFSILGRNNDKTWLYILFTQEGRRILGWASMELIKLNGEIDIEQIPITQQ